MMNARTMRPTGHHTMKPRIIRRIQTGRPNSSSFATTQVGNHTFRATGITAYLKSGGSLESRRHGEPRLDPHDPAPRRFDGLRRVEQGTAASARIGIGPLANSARWILNSSSCRS
jgi:hypothetical protein